MIGAFGIRIELNIRQTAAWSISIVTHAIILSALPSSTLNFSGRLYRYISSPFNYGLREKLYFRHSSGNFDDTILFVISRYILLNFFVIDFSVIIEAGFVQSVDLF